MIKSRVRQSARRQAKQPEIARAQAAILTAIIRDINEFLDDQCELLDQAAVLRRHLQRAKCTAGSHYAAAEIERFLKEQREQGNRDLIERIEP